MARIELSQLIAEMTPEQKIMCQSFYQTFDNRSAANRQIANVEPLHYIGASTGSEFLTYAATKMYLCLSFTSRLVSNSAQATAVSTSFCDATNTAFFAATNDSLTYNTTTSALNYTPNLISINNFFFSRIVPLANTYIIFNGYRVTLV